MKTKIVLVAAALLATMAVRPAAATTAIRPGVATAVAAGLVDSLPVTYRNGGNQFRLSLRNYPYYYGYHRRHYHRYNNDQQYRYYDPYYRNYDYNPYYDNQGQYYRPHYRHRGCHFDPLFGNITCKF